MLPSLAPDERMCLSQAKTPTRAAWPFIERTLEPESTSQIWVSPELSPTARYEPSKVH